jgi:diadenosine tetraphosphatase ApaH/serine/threonine PP2A family protein phosphatase
MMGGGAGVWFGGSLGEALGRAQCDVTVSLADLDRLQLRGRRPSLPAGVRIYAVGDIHGRLDLLNDLLARIDRDRVSRPITRSVDVFLGDYIDRGPSSRETIDRLLEHSQSNEAVFLKGNHELIAIKGLSDRGPFEQWVRRLGGIETLMSYGLSREHLAAGKSIVEMQAAFHAALPRTHLRFLRDLRLSYTCGDFFFAHAGVRPGVEISRQSERDLLWIRDEFLTSRSDFGKIVIHGHTPTFEVEVEPNRINIDTGAFATGRLTCLVIEGSKLSIIDTLVA